MWADNVEKLPADTTLALARWALAIKQTGLHGEFLDPHVPAEVIQGGPSALIDFTLAHRPETMAAKYWSATQDLEGPPDLPTAGAIANELLQEHDWRRGWAIASLRALDLRSPWDSDSILISLEFARARLVFPGTVATIRLASDIRQGGDVGSPLMADMSPFSDKNVQVVLHRLDQIIAAQEAQRERPRQVVLDIQSYGPVATQLIYEALKNHLPDDVELYGQAGSTVAWALRMEIEETEILGQFDRVQELFQWTVLCASRYGTTSDLLAAAHRVAATHARLQPTESVTSLMLTTLEHLLIGAIWLRDMSLEATIHHAVALLLRSFIRKVPGLLDGVQHLERAITLRRHTGETIAAIGSQIDLTSLLIQIGPFSGVLTDIAREVEQWDKSAEAYLDDAVHQLLPMIENPTARSYLGEALFNRARLLQVTGRESEAADSARQVLALASDIGNPDLSARASHLLGQLSGDPDDAIQHYHSAAEAIQQLRKATSSEDIAIAWLVNKAGVFDQQLDLILRVDRSVRDTTSLAATLIRALEESRGLTYNRWLGVKEEATYASVHDALLATLDTSLAIYVVTPQRVAVAMLTGNEPPEIAYIDMSAYDVDQLVRQHLSGLNKQGNALVPIWDRVQAQVMEAGAPLVAPLEPLIARGQNICLIPHRALHGLAFHTLPTGWDNTPIGLRTVVFSNPSLTNWLAARAASTNTPQRAFAGGAWPAEESNAFSDVDIAASWLRSAGVTVEKPGERRTDLAALTQNGTDWRAIHLASHGLFRMPEREIGLLLAADRQLPPRPQGALRQQDTDRHLVTPERLRESGVRARLAFLASCLSARNEELPGDDLMGMTRAIFANGHADMIAGGWTLVSEVAKEFSNHFYESLSTGESTGDAMLYARRQVSQHYPDPFYWGCLIHQGANIRPMAS